MTPYAQWQKTAQKNLSILSEKRSGDVLRHRRAYLAQRGELPGLRSAHVIYLEYCFDPVGVGFARLPTSTAACTGR